MKISKIKTIRKFSEVSEVSENIRKFSVIELPKNFRKIFSEKIGRNRKKSEEIGRNRKFRKFRKYSVVGSNRKFNI